MGGVEPARVFDAFRRLPLSVYATALALHAGIYLTRALRFRALLPQPARPPFAGLLSVSAAHNLAAYVLPAKTGELAFVVYLKKYATVGSGPALASLLVSRVLDLAFLALGVGLAASLLGARGRLPGSSLAFGAVLVVGGLALLGVAARPAWIVAPLQRLGRAFGLQHTRVGAAVFGRVERVSEALTETRGAPRAQVLALSLLVWLGIFFFYAVLARGFGLAQTVSLAEAALGSGFAVLANLLPINGIAGFGTQEGGWVLGFGWLGVPTDLALSTGVSVHLVQLFNVSMMGILGHLGMGLLFRPTEAVDGQASPTRESTSGDSAR